MAKATTPKVRSAKKKTVAVKAAPEEAAFGEALNDEASTATATPPPLLRRCATPTQCGAPPLRRSERGYYRSCFRGRS